MNVESQSLLRDQLLESTIKVLIVMNAFKLTDVIELHSLKESLMSLQNTLLSFREIFTSRLLPFYLLCLKLCEAFTVQLSKYDDDVSELRNISVIEYNLSQFQKMLLALFHALSIYLNIIRRYVRKS